MKFLSMLILVSFLSLNLVFAQDSHSGHSGHEQNEPDAISEVSPDLGICPVMGGETSEEYSYDYEGKTYYFCCPSCIGEFKKDPEKYIFKIKEFKLETYQFGFDPEEIVVNKGDIVRLLVTSKDVIHGVYIKEYNINVTVKKGETKKIEFIAKKSGEFIILCSVYCGRGHQEMKAKLIVK